MAKMSFKVKHLRGYKEEWTASQYIPEDGEIALIRQQDGSYRMKIGNGRARIEALPCVSREVITTPGATEVFPMHNQDVRVEIVSNLTVNIPYPIPEDYSSRVSFQAGSSMRLMIRANEQIYYSGAVTSSSQFTPKTDARYTIFFWYDGRMRCRIEEGFEQTIVY